MTRATYVFRDGQLIDKRLAPPPAYQRSSLKAPYIRTDGMSATWNPVNGKHYDSKSAYERAVRNAGCVIVGDDSSLTRAEAPQFAAEGVEQSISTAIDRLAAGHRPEPDHSA